MPCSHLQKWCAGSTASARLFRSLQSASPPYGRAGLLCVLTHLDLGFSLCFLLTPQQKFVLDPFRIFTETRSSLVAFEKLSVDPDRASSSSQADAFGSPDFLNH